MRAAEQVRVRDRAELAAFLRSRRARRLPDEVGLPGGGRRRTPGLRRQEVAQLAGVSVDYYVRIEQARGPRPSRQVLSALARALLLTRDEREYLFRIAGENPAAVPGPSREVTPAVRYLLDSLVETRRTWWMRSTTCSPGTRWPRTSSATCGRSRRITGT